MEFLEKISDKPALHMYIATKPDGNYSVIIDKLRENDIMFGDRFDVKRNELKDLAANNSLYDFFESRPEAATAYIEPWRYEFILTELRKFVGL